MPRSLNKNSRVVLIAHNIRSTHNVGSLFRTAEGLGVSELLLSGYSPYPKLTRDKRLDYLAIKQEKQIEKTALGSQKMLPWRKINNLAAEVSKLRNDGYQIVGLEQHKRAINIKNFRPKDMIAVILGNETTGLEADEIKLCDLIVEIPMLGKKESFNVVQAAAMALFAIVHLNSNVDSL